MPHHRPESPLFQLPDDTRVSRSGATASAGLAMALCVQLAAGDTVVMRNGDRLTGEVVRQEGSELLLRTEYAGLDLIKSKCARS